MNPYFVDVQPAQLNARRKPWFLASLTKELPMRLSWKALVLVVGLARVTVLADDKTIPSALESDPHGWTDLLAKAGPKLEGWTSRSVAGAGQATSRLAMVARLCDRSSGMPGRRRT